jgi:NSS family neurotransmitter:Na+ symporter
LVLVLRRGLKKGIELANNIMMPALLIILVILIVRALTLPDVSQGLSFYLKPDIHKFSWDGALAAIGQTFFAVGVAMATALVYGSYLPKESRKVISNSTIIVLASTLIAFMAGLIIIPSVYAFGLDPAAGAGLTFITMPNVFNQMPAGRLFGTLFYILFFLAALTSFIGAFEGIIAWIRDQLGITREKGVWVVGGGILLLSSLSAASTKIFNLADYVVNNVFLIFGALFMTLFVGWVWGVPNFARAAGIGSHSARLVWSFLIKFLIPLIIVLVGLNELGIGLEISRLFK